MSKMKTTPDCLPWCRVDGNTTLGENMADHGGLSMALEAYTSWRRHNRDVRLPALPFDDMQLFFLGTAQQLLQCILTQSPGIFRLRAPVVRAPHRQALYPPDSQ